MSDIADLGAPGPLVPALAFLCVLVLSWSALADEARTLSFYNIHTKETVTVAFKRDGEYVPEGMKQINHIMRDWRRNESTEMDPELIDLIWELHKELGSKEPVHLISGYRSHKTNSRLRRAGGGQAKNSRHILGKAADIHFPDVSVKALRNSALVREAGGVGYYPRSGLPFVHVDTGRVRHWPRLPRQELAALFPSGNTEHIPADGRPITLADASAAIALDKSRRPDRAPVEPEARAVAAKADDPEVPEAVVADASDAISNQRKRSKDLLELTAAKAEPPVITAGAGLGSLSLPWLAKASGLTPTVTDERHAQPPAPTAKLHLASADITGAIADRPEQPPIANPAVAAAPEYDPEHPEELVYQPLPILTLMAGSDVASNRDLVAFERPAYKEADYLLTEPDRGLELPLEPLTGVTRLAFAQVFTGAAVRNLLRPVAGKLLTASVDEPPEPVPAAMPAPVPSGPAPSAMGFAPIPR